MRLRLFILTLTSLLSPAVLADEPVADAGQNAVAAHLGIASAIGSVGGAYQRYIGDAAIEAGAGVGGSGLQLSAMPKLVLGEGRNRFMAGVGLALALDGDDERVWLNVDLAGWEHRFDSGWLFSLAGGLTHLLTSDEPCTGDFLLCWSEPEVLPQLRVGLGYLF